MGGLSFSRWVVCRFDPPPPRPSRQNFTYRASRGRYIFSYSVFANGEGVKVGGLSFSRWVVCCFDPPPSPSITSYVERKLWYTKKIKISIPPHVMGPPL